MLFVLEVVLGIVALEVAVPVAIAATIATLITRFALGEGPLYGQRAFALESNHPHTHHGERARVRAAATMRSCSRY